MVNKKLHYREEHSASVVLSWCTLWHFSGENLLMANQSVTDRRTDRIALASTVLCVTSHADAL